MQNTGTWDSDLAIIFFMCLMAPIAFHFLGAILQSGPKQADPTPPRQKPTPTFTPTFTPASVNISVSAPNLFKGSSSTGKSRKKTKRVTRPKKKNLVPTNPKPKPKPKPLTDKAVVSEAVGGLCNLGYKKGDATKIVKSISDKKKYDSVESLVKDCFMCIS